MREGNYTIGREACEVRRDVPVCRAHMTSSDLPADVL